MTLAAQIFSWQDQPGEFLQDLIFYTNLPLGRQEKQTNKQKQAPKAPILDIHSG